MPMLIMIYCCFTSDVVVVVTGRKGTALAVKL